MTQIHIQSHIRRRAGYLMVLVGVMAGLFACAPTPPPLKTPEISDADIFDELIALPAAPEDVEVNPESGYIYVVYRHYPYLTVLDSADGSIVASVPLPKSSHRIGIHPGTNRIYVIHKQRGSLSVIDGYTHTVMTQFDIGRWPRNIAVNPASNMIYVSDERRDRVLVISGDTQTLINTIPVGRTPRGITVNPVTNLVYVANWKDDTVSVIDGDTAEVVDTLSVGSDPEALAVESELNKAFVSNLLSSNVYVLDGDNGHGIIGVIPVQEVPGSLTVDEVHDWLFVTNTDAHSLSIVDVFSLHVLDTAPTQEFPLDVAVNPNTGMLYVIHRHQPALFVVNIVTE